MKRKRPRRKAQKPSKAAHSAAPSANNRPLQYKVVELSTVDESALESSINEWVARGWTLDGIQFAMRESSKRPAMAFVLFTRPSAIGADTSPEPRIAPVTALPAAPRPMHEARNRLAQLAGVDELPPEPEPT
jgi:hypothetical protein